MLAPIGIMIMPREANMNSFDFKLESGASYDFDFPEILGKNTNIKINVKKLIAKIQNIAIRYPKTVPRHVVIGRPTMLPTDIPSRILVI